MLGLVFTTPHEAVPFLDEYANARADALEPEAPIQLDDVLVAATGPGKINATLRTERILTGHDLDTLIHAGCCTGLSENMSVGTVVGVSHVLEGDRVDLDSPVYPRMPLECPLDTDVEGTLVSQDHSSSTTTDSGDASDETSSLSYWERLADVRDETGYAVTYVAAQHGTPCHIVKGISDHINADADSPDAPPARTAVSAILQPFLKDRSRTG